MNQSSRKKGLSIMVECTKTHIIGSILLIFATTAFFALPAWAAHPDPSSEIENLKRRIEILESEKTKDDVSNAPFNLERRGKIISLSGLLELETVYERDDGGNETSDFSLATMELSAEANINDNIGGHIILLWEGDDNDPIDVDEAVITLNCKQTFLEQTLTFNGGKMYLPFGQFNSYMISDPLTLELAETNNTAVTFGLEGGLWSLQSSFFNGESETGNSDSIDTWVAALQIKPREGFTLGASYISDLAESGNGLVTDDTVYTESIAGFGTFLSLAYGAFNLEAEYILALNNFSAAVEALGEDLSGETPAAWNLELAWIPNEQWQIAVRAEGAKDFKQDGKRYGGAVTYGLFKKTLLALEYLRTDDNETARHPVHTISTQLALSF